MNRRPINLSWRPTTFLGRVLAAALGLCLFALLLVVSVAAVAIALASLGLYLGYAWWKSRSIARHSNENRVIDVVPEVIDERRTPERHGDER